MNRKVSELTAITSDAVASTDVLPIVDVSATTTKKITKAELAEAIGISNTPVDLTGLTTGDALVYESGSFVPAQAIPVTYGPPVDGNILQYSTSSGTYGPVDPYFAWPMDCAPGWIPRKSLGVGHVFRAASSSGSAFTLDRLYVVPVAFNRSVPIQIGIQTTTFASSSVTRVGVYSDTSDDLPGTLLFSENLDTSASSGVKYATATFTPSAGVKYWLAVLQNGAVAQMLSMNSTSAWAGIPPFKGNYGPSVGYYHDSQTSLPSTFTTDPTAAGNSFPYIYLCRTT